MQKKIATMKSADGVRPFIPWAGFVVLSMIEALVAAYGTSLILSRVPLLWGVIEFVQRVVPVAPRLAACAGPEGTIGALVAVSAMFLPLKVLALFAAFPFTLQDTDRLWSGYRPGSPGTARRWFLHLRRALLLGLCVVPGLFVFVGFADDIDTGRALGVTLARYRRFCGGGLAAYPQWLLYTMFATVPCLVFPAAASSLWRCVRSRARGAHPALHP